MPYLQEPLILNDTVGSLSTVNGHPETHIPTNDEPQPLYLDKGKTSNQNGYVQRYVKSSLNDREIETYNGHPSFQQNVSDDENKLCKCWSGNADGKTKLTKYLQNTHFVLSKSSNRKILNKLQLEVDMLPKAFCNALHTNSLPINDAEFYFHISENNTMDKYPAKIDSNKLFCEFVPSKPGFYTIELYELTHISYRSNRLLTDFITIEEPRPKYSFKSDNDSYRPVAIATTHSNVYVAYYDHVCRFLPRGDLDTKLIQLDDGNINDMAVNDSYIVLAVSGWKEEEDSTYRFQEVRIHGTDGAFRDKLGWEPPVFNNPVLRVCITDDAKVIIPDKDGLYTYELSTSELSALHKLEHFKLGFVSRIRFVDGRIYALDASENCIKVYDGEFFPVQKIELNQISRNKTPHEPCNSTTFESNAIEQVNNISNVSASSFCVDVVNELIMVCDCVSGGVYVYAMTSGRLLGEWAGGSSTLKWPLDVCWSRRDNHNRQLLVADHYKHTLTCYDM